MKTEPGDFPDIDGTDDTATVFADWRDFALNVGPVNLEEHRPTRGGNPYRRPMLQASVSKLMRRRATVAAAQMGISKDAWLRLLIAQAIHAQLGDDMDELLAGTARIIRYEATYNHVDE